MRYTIFQYLTIAAICVVSIILSCANTCCKHSNTTLENILGLCKEGEYELPAMQTYDQTINCGIAVIICWTPINNDSKQYILSSIDINNIRSTTNDLLTRAIKDINNDHFLIYQEIEQMVLPDYLSRVFPNARWNVDLILTEFVIEE